MSSAKAKALAAITTMPDDVDSQQLLLRLMQVQQGILQHRFERDEEDQDSPPSSLHGALRGSVHIQPGFDLTQPVLDEDWEADQGMLHR